MIYRLLILISLTFFSCAVDPASTVETPVKNVKLITVDPGHFHAALVQKKMYNQIDSLVHVYAPEGIGVKQHLQMIKQYNSRADTPTSWHQKAYIGEDFIEKLLEEKPGNVAVLAGDNAAKIDYVTTLLNEGINVLADKPLIITPDRFSSLKNAFSVAEKNNLLLYDIMTERNNIFYILQNELIRQPELFGELRTGSPGNPAIIKKSLHHISKNVSGKPLIRPAAFFDVAKQGEGVTDIPTHFIDLILWGVLEKENISVENTLVLNAERFPTKIDRAQFQKVTGLDHFPEHLQKDLINDSTLNLYSNGSVTFRANGYHSKVSIVWKFEAPEGGGDTFYSEIRGTKANVLIKQGKAENFKPTLYVEPLEKVGEETAEANLKAALAAINEKYPGVSYEPANDGWRVVIPEEYIQEHEVHFSYVMENYLEYLNEGKLPEWEKKLMLTKYYITTEAWKISREKTSG